MSFDAELAGLTARMSRSAYRSADAAAGDISGLGFGGFRWYSDESTQAFSCSGAGRLHVAFRGTEANPIDWTRNARFKPVVGELDGRVHSGFRSGVDEVWGEVLSGIASAAKPVVFTGHSLGGALATLAAARTHQAGHTVAGVYTFGQPRVGRGDFRSAYEDALGEVTYRLINHIDIVTRIPLMIQGYRHVGQRIYFDASGSLHFGTSAWKVALDDIKYRLAHFGRIKEAAGLSPHDMAAYVSLAGTL